MKVCMFVFNNCRNDARVLKEANSLTEAGFDVRIIAVLDKLTTPFEKRGGFRIIRVQVVRNSLRHLQQTLKLKIKRFRNRLRRWFHPLKRSIRIFRNRLRRLIFSPLKRTLRRLIRIPRRIIWRLAEIPFFHRVYVALGKPLVGLARKIVLLFFRRADENKPGRASFITRLAIRLKQSLANLAQIIQTAIRAEISKDYVKEMIRRYPWFFFSIGWSILLVRFIVMTPGKLIDSIDRFYQNFAMFPVYSSYYRSAFKIVKGEPAVVYHAHDLNTLPVAFWASRKHGARLVYDSHELFIETSTLPEIQKRIWRIVERGLIHRADKVITVNGSIAEELSKRYDISLPVVVMNAPNLSSRPRFRQRKNLLRQKLELDVEVPIILYQGGYTPNRGLENLILAAHTLEQGIIVFMGWGRLEKSLRELVMLEKLDERVKFTDPVPPELLLKYTQCADLGVIPYQFVGLNNYYTTPNKLFEYMMAGLPVVGSDFPELRRFIIEYGLGKVFNPDDPKDIAKTISDVLSDPASYKKYKQSGRRAAKIFNWENESKKLISAYTEMENSH